ncbi:RDD family protein [Bradyrhizobium sp.]|uniref:RDD family protein n=1 Tax=Bradyrhizobium sp. TaxID=376 RepID=UPI002D5B36A8|nr:RDD family protein [Bradyrhizobium sp.]HZR75938.1 RDD family protein [Bradyrhizobium sp.]
MNQRLDRINHFLDGVTRNRREIVTPEGVVLETDVANNGERLTAFLIDFLFWILATILLYLVFALLAVEHMSGAVASTIIFLFAFLLRNLYFIHFELTTQGSTPGKRIVNLRVIDRNGGPLLPGAIIARNLTREVEIFLPLGLFLTMPKIAAGWSFWLSASYFGWIVLISALPFFNRDHLRAGDLIAGTMVISMPRRKLLAELVEAQAKYVFTRSQLDAYGAFELQVLEEVLRRPPSEETKEIQRQICGRICRKIGWTGSDPSGDALDFLKAFYTAERAHLEREQLFGRYRSDKADQSSGRK